MLAAVAVAAVEAVEAVVGMLEEVAVAVGATLEAAVVCIQSAMLAALVGAAGVTAVVALGAVVVCMRGRHAQLTAWVDRVADTSLAGSHMAEPSKFGISLSNFHEREGKLTR